LPNAFSVKPAHESILKSLYTYYYLTAKQVCRLHYSPGSFTRVEKLLKELRDNQYLQWDFLPVKRRFGSSPAYYMLARRGVAYLRSLGFDVSLLPYPSEKRQLKSLFIPHTITVNDFLIAASLLPRVAPDICLYDMRHELLMKRIVKGPVIPDGWLDFRRGNEQICFWLEVDRGTEDVKVFREKIRSQVTFSKTSYHEVFHTPSITIVFATTAGDLRCKNMLTWTEQTLTEIHEAQEADLFRFGTIPEGPLDPAWLFFEPFWTAPFSDTPLPLLEA
jgi:hypothetical protein